MVAIILQLLLKQMCYVTYLLVFQPDEDGEAQDSRKDVVRDREHAFPEAEKLFVQRLEVTWWIVDRASVDSSRFQFFCKLRDVYVFREQGRVPVVAVPYVGRHR